VNTMAISKSKGLVAMKNNNVVLFKRRLYAKQNNCARG
jgi:hypothetical protein